METLRSKYYSDEELIQFAKENKTPEKYFVEFPEFIENEIKIMTEDGDLSDAEMKQAALDNALEYFIKYDIELNKGHGKQWAAYYSESIEEPHHAFNHTYNYLHKTNPELAKKELAIHCAALGEDEIYTKYFIYLMENGGGLDKPNKQAAIYSKIFREQVALGKSEIYAHEYAESSAEGNPDLYVEVYAKYYEVNFKKNKSRYYSFNFADELAEYVNDHYTSSVNYENDEYFIVKLVELRDKFEKME